MELLRQVDPVGVQARRSRRLKRREYRASVGLMAINLHHIAIEVQNRDQICCGTWMATTSFLLMGCAYMDVLMGMSCYQHATFL